MILYKYVPPERIDILQNKCIRFTPINEFNDPFEFSLNMTIEKKSMVDFLMKKYLKSIKKAVFTYNPNLIHFEHQINWREKVFEIYKNDTFYTFVNWKKIFINIRDDISQKIAILSLSETRDNLLMWGHYTNNHTGIVIGFDTDNFISNPLVDLPKKVNYKDEKVNIHLTHIENISLNKNIRKDTNLAILTKSTHWKYEKEWRCLIDLKSINSLSEIKGLVTINPKAIKEIILGVNVDVKLQNLVLNLKKNHPEYKNINIYKASMNLTKYLLDIEKV